MVHENSNEDKFLNAMKIAICKNMIILDSSSLKNPSNYVKFLDEKITKIKNVKIETDDWDFPEEEIPPHKLKQKLEENEMAKK